MRREQRRGEVEPLKRRGGERGKRTRKTMSESDGAENWLFLLGEDSLRKRHHECIARVHMPVCCPHEVIHFVKQTCRRYERSVTISSIQLFLARG